MTTRELEPTHAAPPTAEPSGTAADADRKEANTMLLGGLGIGALGVVSAAVGGAVCPVCVVAAPALLGIGAYRRWRASKLPRVTPGSSDGAESSRG